MTNETPGDVQAQINAVPWTNGRMLVTGATVAGLFTAVVGLFSAYLTPTTPFVDGNGGSSVSEASRWANNVYANNFTALSDAEAVAVAKGSALVFPVGSYDVSNKTFTTPVVVQPGAVLNCATGQGTFSGSVIADKQQIFGTGCSPTLSSPGSKQNALYPEWWGAGGHNLTDDTTAIQAWLNALKGGGYEGICSGTYQLTSGVNGFSQTNQYHVHGPSIGGCNFYINFNGWASSGIDLTNPTSPTNANRGVSSEWDHFTISYNSALTSPPIAFKDRYATDLKLHDFYISQFTVNRGTCLSLSAAFNVEKISNGDIWGCGQLYGSHLVPNGTTFSIASSATTLSSSAAFFSSADVGLAIYCRATPGGYDEVFNISSFVNSTSVTVGRAASTTHTAVLCALSGVTGTISAASPTLTLSAAVMSSADVGRSIYVEAAGAALNTAIDAARSTIQSVSGAVVTMANNATTASAGAQVIVSPVVEVYPEVDAPPNDVVFFNIHLEDGAGDGLLIQDCLNCRWYAGSSKGQYLGSNFGQTNFETQFNATFFGSDVIFSGADIEGAAINFVGKILVEGLAMSDAIGPLTGIVVTGQHYIGMYHNEFASVVTAGPINSAATFDATNWGQSLLFSDGTSSVGFGNSGVIGAYNSALTLGSTNAFKAASTFFFSGVTASINGGGHFDSGYFNSCCVSSTNKNSNPVGLSAYYLGTDQSNTQSSWIVNGSTDSSGNGVNSTTLFGRNGLWLSGSATAGTGLEFDSSGNAVEHGTLAATALPASAGAGGLYVCVDTSGNFYKKSACP